MKKILSPGSKIKSLAPKIVYMSTRDCVRVVWPKLPELFSLQDFPPEIIKEVTVIFPFLSCSLPRNFMDWK